MLLCLITAGIDLSVGANATFCACICGMLVKGGMKLADVVKTTVFLADMNDFAKINAIYAEAFGSNKPARSCVEVSKLPNGGLFEIEAIAVKE